MAIALTFDFWDTLFIDDSDEPERTRLGLPPKAEARFRLFRDEVRCHHEVPVEGLRGAWDRAGAWAQEQWRTHHHTPTVSVRLQVALRALELRPTSGFHELVHSLEHMELEPAPRPVPGMVRVLEELGRHYRLGIVSDTIMSPGRVVRRLLDGAGMLEQLDFCVFSDEVGHSKPHPAVFHAAAEGLGVPVTELVQVGDRQDKDVAGAQGAGARAIHFAVVRDRGVATTTAEAVCHHVAELPELAARLAAVGAAS